MIWSFGKYHYLCNVFFRLLGITFRAVLSYDTGTARKFPKGGNFAEWLAGHELDIRTLPSKLVAATASRKEGFIGLR